MLGKYELLRSKWLIFISLFSKTNFIVIDLVNLRFGIFPKI